MSLPEELPVHLFSSFGDKKDGYFRLTYTNEEFGIMVIRERQGCDQSFTETWKIKSIPEKIFHSYEELKEAMRLPLELKAKVCAAIMDSGFIGNAEEYVRANYNKDFEELTVNEAEMIINSLGKAK